MSYQSDIQATLTANAGITAIVGDRIFSDVADGSAQPPYLVYQIIATSGQTTHDGNRNLEFPLIQFSCWGAGKAAVIALASAVNTALDGVTHAGTSNVSTVFSNQSGTYDSETELFGEILEYRAATNKN